MCGCVHMQTSEGAALVCVGKEAIPFHRFQTAEYNAVGPIGLLVYLPQNLTIMSLT